MLDVEIYKVRNELNRLIEKGVDLSELYELSIKLDKLILQYYSRKDHQVKI